MIELTLDNANEFDRDTIYEWYVAVVSNSVARRGKHATGTVVAVFLQGERKHTPSADEAREFTWEYREATVAQAIVWLRDKATKAEALDVVNTRKARLAGRIR